MDAHEKLAKIWGFWAHLLVDGHSRKILHISVDTDKLASTVRTRFVETCRCGPAQRRPLPLAQPSSAPERSLAQPADCMAQSLIPAQPLALPRQPA